jgi:hypothetical protein
MILKYAITCGAHKPKGTHYGSYMMKKHLLAISSIFLALLSTTALAETTCIRKSIQVRKGKVNIAGNIKRVLGHTCPNRYQALIVEDQGVAGWAKLGFSGTVQSFGGSRLASVTASHTNLTGQSYYQISFVGYFNGLGSSDSAANREKIIVLSSAQEGNYNVTNAVVTYADPLEVRVRVNYWTSDTTNSLGAGNGVTVALFQSE